MVGASRSQDHISRRILQSVSRAQDNGIPETMVCRTHAYSVRWAPTWYNTNSWTESWAQGGLLPVLRCKRLRAGTASRTKVSAHLSAHLRDVTGSVLGEKFEKNLLGLKAIPPFQLNVCTQKNLCIHISIYLYTYVYTFIFTYTYVYKHIHKHTHRCTPSCWLRVLRSCIDMRMRGMCSAG